MRLRDLRAHGAFTIGGCLGNSYVGLVPTLRSGLERGQNALMRIQDFVAAETEQAVKSLFDTARYVPADKLEWKPLDNGRSCLDQLQECAQAPTWFQSILETRQVQEFDPAKYEEMRVARRQWDTLEKCEEVCRTNTAKLIETIRNFPDEHLSTGIPHPFAPGETIKLAHVMLWHYWNTVYHIGQINYIQTLLGDFEMR